VRSSYLGSLVIVGLMSVYESWTTWVWFPTGTENFNFPLTARLLDRPASYPTVTGAFSPGVKRPEHEADHLPPSSADVMNTWSCTSNLMYVIMIRYLIRDKFTELLSVECKFLDYLKRLLGGVKKLHGIRTYFAFSLHFYGYQPHRKMLGTGHKLLCA
jgi:hypothetical protein